jgi:FkbM family methyltransferase
MKTVPSFLTRFAQTPLGQVFADQTWVSVYDRSLMWLDLPSQAFLDYATTAEVLPFDVVHDNPAEFRKKTPWIVAQAHRIWLTLKALEPLIPDGGTLLNLGAFPFTIDTAIRRYLKKDCRIIATINQALSPQAEEALKRFAIETIPVNLDPHVEVEHPLPGMTDYLPLADESVDVILFAHVIEHLYHPIQILRECFRVLKKGGKLLIATDHGFLIGGFLNYLNEGQYLHEPVEGTAAMVFHEWRGHVRYFTEGDLRGLVKAAGGAVTDVKLYEVLYNSFPEEYFVSPNTRMPKWRAELLTEFPQFRNEIFVIAERPVPFIDPLDPQANQGEWRLLRQQWESGVCEVSKPTSVDYLFAVRMLLNRWPTRAELDEFRKDPPPRAMDGMLAHIMRHPDFAGRQYAIEYDRPGAECIVMTETWDKFRFFFSVQDTFVGFPVALNLFEPELTRAVYKLLKPGMNCIDIGANLGYYALRMAREVAPGGGRVFAFEPDPFSADLLERNIRENKMEDVVTAFRLAAGAEARQATLYRHPNPVNFGGCRIREHDTTAVVGTVAVRRVDDLIPLDVPVSLVKMEIEGYEPLAFRGMERIVREYQPVIVTRFNTADMEFDGVDAPGRFYEALVAAGYRVYDAFAFADGRLEAFNYPGAGYRNTDLVCLPEGYTLPENFGAER